MPEIDLKMNLDAARDWMNDQAETFDLGPYRLKVATRRAINRTLGHRRSLISMEIRDRYYAKKNEVDNSMKLKEVNSLSKQKGVISYRARASLPLSSFGALQGKTFVSVRVLKAHKRRRIQPGGKWDILQSSTRNVRKKGTKERTRVPVAAVWMAKGQVWARVAGQEHPKMLYGPNFMSFFNLPNVAKALGIEMNEYFSKRLAHETRAYHILGDLLDINYGQKK